MPSKLAQQTYRKRHREKINKKRHDAYYRDIEKSRSKGREGHFKRAYGLTSEKIAAMLLAQDGLCAICRKKPAKVVDHNHLTGKVRAMLCHRCNHMLAGVEEKDFLSRAHVYLELYS